MTLDEWAAKECGQSIEVKDNGIIWQEEEATSYEWTLNDARCREIVREIMHIETASEWFRGENEWVAISAWQDSDDRQWALEGRGKTIAEAEMACIEQIRRASDE